MHCHYIMPYSPNVGGWTRRRKTILGARCRVQPADTTGLSPPHCMSSPCASVRGPEIEIRKATKHGKSSVRCAIGASQLEGGERAARIFSDLIRWRLGSSTTQHVLMLQQKYPLTNKRSADRGSKMIDNACFERRDHKPTPPRRTPKVTKQACGRGFRARKTVDRLSLCSAYFGRKGEMSAT